MSLLRQKEGPDFEVKLGATIKTHCGQLLELLRSVEICFQTLLSFFNIYLTALALCCGTQDLSGGDMWTLSWGLWDLVPWPGMEPRPPALGAQSLSHWTTREVPPFRTLTDFCSSSQPPSTKFALSTVLEFKINKMLLQFYFTLSSTSIPVGFSATQKRCWCSISQMLCGFTMSRLRGWLRSLASPGFPSPALHIFSAVSNSSQPTCKTRFWNIAHL